VNETPEAIFMHAWARSLVERVHGEVKRWCHDRSRPDWFAVFSAYYLHETSGTRPTQQALADRYRCSRDQIKYALEQTREEFVRLMRITVADQVSSPSDLDAEIREIEQLLAS
jgi:hypothetical protein